MRTRDPDNLARSAARSWSCARAISGARRRASHADDQAKARAQGLLSEGTAAYGRGDYAAALDKFTAAYKIFPSPKLWFNIGQANRDLGRPVEAVEAFDRFLARRGRRPARDAGRGAPLGRRAEDQARPDQGDAARPTAPRSPSTASRSAAPRSATMMWTTPGRHQVAAQHVGFSPAIEDVVGCRRQGRRRQHRAAPDRSARCESTTADGAIVRTRRRRPPPASGAAPKHSPSIAGPGSGSRSGPGRRRGRHRRDHSSRAAAAAAVDPASVPGDDARRAEGVLMMRRFWLPSPLLGLALALALLVGRGGVRRQRQRHPAEEQSDRRDSR